MADLERRRVLGLMAGAGAALTTGCSPLGASEETQATRRGQSKASSPASGGSRAGAGSQAFDPAMGADAVGPMRPQGPIFETSDPFLFCAYHDDRYPAGNALFGPQDDLRGRRIGSDFAGKDGWRMYHGDTVPGFPKHPHRGFETVTVVRKGLLDHSDSLGARARYGEGDLQWLTAGRGINHAEMFPLLKPDAPNPLELFQIWLNLPREDKMVAPAFSMFWDPTIPKHQEHDSAGRMISITTFAGRYRDKVAPTPPRNSWAARADSDVAIWTIGLDPGAQWVLPSAGAATKRSLYLFDGSGVRAGGKEIPPGHRLQLLSPESIALEAGAQPCQLLLLQGRPIGEPVARHGPFVMNTEQEIRQAYADYRATGFGGWPWDGDDPVHGADPQRFAQLVDGSDDRPA